MTLCVSRPDLCGKEHFCIIQIVVSGKEQYHPGEGPAAVCAQIDLVSKSTEFNAIQLRVNEKRSLNSLNRDKNRTTIRSDMLVNTSEGCRTACLAD